MNVFEHLLEVNKNRILNSDLSMVLYKNKPIADYYQNNKVVNLDFEHNIDDVLFFVDKSDMPEYNYNDFNQKYNIYKKYPNLCLLSEFGLYKISSLITFLQEYKASKIIPLGNKGIKWASNKREVYKEDKFTGEIITDILDTGTLLYKELEFLKLTNVYDWMITTDWSEYENLIKELAQ